MSDDQVGGIVIEIDDDVKSTSSFQEDMVKVDSSNSSVNDSNTDLSYENYERDRKSVV